MPSQTTRLDPSKREHKSNILHGTVPKTKFQQDKAFTEKMHRWHHNALFGSTMHSRANMNSVINSTSATPKAKELAQQAFDIIQQCADELYKYRVELDGSTRVMAHEGAAELERLRNGG
jgi:hypothetical protein